MEKIYQFLKEKKQIDNAFFLDATLEYAEQGFGVGFGVVSARLS